MSRCGNLVPIKSAIIILNGLRPDPLRGQALRNCQRAAPAGVPSSANHAPPASRQPTAAKPRLPGRPSNRLRGPGPTLESHVARPGPLPARRRRLTSPRTGVASGLAGGGSGGDGCGPRAGLRARTCTLPARPRARPGAAASARSAPAPSPALPGRRRWRRPGLAALLVPRLGSGRPRLLCGEEAESVRDGGGGAWRPPGPRLAARDAPALVSLSGPLPSRVRPHNSPPLLSGRRRSLTPSLPSPLLRADDCQTWRRLPRPASPAGALPVCPPPVSRPASLPTFFGSVAIL